MWLKYFELTSFVDGHVLKIVLVHELVHLHEHSYVFLWCDYAVVFACGTYLFHVIVTVVLEGELVGYDVVKHG